MDIIFYKFAYNENLSFLLSIRFVKIQKCMDIRSTRRLNNKNEMEKFFLYNCIVIQLHDNVQRVEYKCSICSIP